MEIKFRLLMVIKGEKRRKEVFTGGIGTRSLTNITIGFSS